MTREKIKKRLERRKNVVRREIDRFVSIDEYLSQLSLLIKGKCWNKNLNSFNLNFDAAVT